jgi:hypothetical protein
LYCRRGIIDRRRWYDIGIQKAADSSAGNYQSVAGTQAVFVVEDNRQKIVSELPSRPQSLGVVELEQLERNLIAVLRIIWKMLGKRREIIRLDK